MKYIFSFATILLLGSFLGKGQPVNLILNAPETGNQYHTARQSINFAGGYQYTPGAGELNTRIFPAVNGSVTYGSMIDPQTRSLNTSYLVGATEGSFNVSPMGSATYNISIDLPPGVNGLTPDLSLVYGSMGGPGIAGYGWQLGGNSAITRTPQTIYQDEQTKPVNLDSNDRFALDGQRLVCTSGNYGDNNSQYRTENDIFTRVTAYVTTSYGPDKFKAETKSGQIYEYGYTSDAVQKIGSLNPALSWYVSSVSDLFGSRINYYYLNQDGNVYPATIEYGPNSVRFYYKERTDAVNSYFKGAKMIQKLLLDKIEVVYNNLVLKTYEFKYGYLSNNYYGQSFLNEIIENGQSGSRLNSTAFNYQYPGNISFSYSGFVSSGSLCQNSTAYSGDFNGDGKEEIFTVADDHKYWHLQYTNDMVNFYNMSWGSTPFTIDWAVPTDLNGDGKQDLILINHYYAVYKYYYCLSTGNSFTTPVEFVEKNDINSFYDAKYKHSGDFDGDGVQDFLCKHRFLGSDLWTVYSLYHAPNPLPTPTYMEPKYSGTIESWGSMDYVGDFNGDGKTDIWVFTSIGLKIYTVDGNSLTTLCTSSAVTSSNKFQLGDFNGDGKTDLFVYGTSSADWSNWQILTSTGAGFETHAFGAKKTNLKNDNVYPTDLNGDGKTDILAMSLDSYGDPLSYYFISNLNGDNFSSNTKPGFSKTNTFNFGDYDGDGVNEIVEMFSSNGYGVTKNNVNNGVLLSSIGDGLGNITRISYQKISGNSFYQKGDESDNFPVFTYQGPLNAVSEVFQNDNEHHTYAYEGLKIHRLGKGILCFKKISDTESYTGITVENQYSYHTSTGTSWYYPQLITTTKRHGNDNMSIVTNGYSQIEFNTSPGTKRIFPYVHTTSEQNVLTGQTVSSSLDYDNYGNIITSSKNYGTRTESTTNTITNIDNGSQWLLGRVTNSSTTCSGTGTPITRQINRSYLSTSNLVETETYFPSTSNELVKSYEYYSSGNLKKETKSGDGVQRITQYEYDGNNIRVNKVTDPLGHETNKAYNLYGFLDTETDYLNNSISYTYDNLGRPNVQTSSDGSNTTTSLHWANGSGPSTACYYQQKEGNDGSLSKTWFDKEGREIRKDTRGFNGNMIAALKTYNTKGQIISESEPYYESGSPSQTTGYTYDDYGRPASISRFSGSNTSYSYSGNTVTETTNGDTFTKSYNADGTLAQATDNGGTIAYAYYPDGKSHTVSKDGNAVITLAYDIAGNKTQTADVSAGTINYTYTKFGELKTQTNPRNDVTTYTYYDDGRIYTRVTPEGTTTYGYNGNKQLNSVTSPGGISRSQAYDSKGRVQNITETIDGANYQTTFTYDGIGRLDTRIHPSGIVEKSNYNSYGYLYQTLADNQVVWTISTMDERQNIRSGVYGNGTLSATFGFDSYGLPNSSVVTGIQNYSYSFDPVRGNLTWRKNEINGIQENFTYDNLDRLTGTYRGGTLYHQTSFDSNGNITGKSDFGVSYSYNTPGNPNAASEVTDSPVDLPQSQNISYASFEKAVSISEGNYSADFAYNSDYDRALMTVKNNGTTFLTRRYAGSRYMKETLNGTDSEYTYLGGDAYSAPVVAVKTGGSTTYYYIIRDYLGSITHVYNSSNATTREYSYDAWGRRRNATDWSYDMTGQPELLADRGFTSHEHLTWFNLVNMNGRLYDPLAGAFVSPDPNVQMPDNTQGLNRYVYCLNNPLLYVDPSGYSFLSNFGSWIGKNWKTVLTVGAAIAVTAIVTVATAGTCTALVGAAIAGGAGSFTSGAVGTWLNGGSFLQGLGAGLQNAPIGIVAGMAGYGVGAWAAKNIGGIVINSLNVTSKSIIGRVVTGAIGGYAGAFAAGTATGFIKTGNLGKALEMGAAAGPGGAAIGATVSGIQGLRGAGEAKKAGDYDFTPNSDGDNVTLYRGTTGSEGKSGALFMTDDPGYAATYVKNGGSVIQVTIPRSTFLQMQYDGTLNTLNGVNVLTNTAAREFQIIRPEVINKLLLNSQKY